METAESRAKLANAIRTMQANGQSNQIPSLVSAYKVKYQSTPAPVVPQEKTFGQKVSGGIQKIFPGQKVGQAIGTLAGYALTPKENRKYYDTSAPTPLQVAGDVAQGALTVGTAGGVRTGLQGVSRVGKLAGVGSNALNKVTIDTAKTVGGRALQNTAIGAGFGATTGIKEKQSVGDTLKSTAIGAGTGLAAGLVLDGAIGAYKGIKRTPAKEIAKTEKELQRIENNYQKLRKNAKFSKDGNIATRNRVAKSGVLSDATDSTGTIITDKAIKRYRDLSPLNKTEGVVRNNLERLGETIDVDTLERKLIQSVYDSGQQGANLESSLNTIEREIAGYRRRATPDGRIPLTLLHDAKIDVYNTIDFNTPAEIKAYKKTLAKGLKEAVEENSSFNVKEVNETLSPYLKDIEYLESLNGRKVKGGKLGKYSARIAGNIAGGIAGGSVGGLPGSAVGTIVGGEVGDAIQGKILKGTFGKTVETALPESKILQKAVQTGNSPRAQLPAPKAGQPRIQQVSGRTINLPQRTQSAVDAQSLANLKAQKIAPPSKIPSKVSISKTIPEKKPKSKLSLKDNRGFIASGYKGESDLTTKILKDLEGKTTVSKQYILDATNRGELKQVERDLIRQVLDDMDTGKSNLYNKTGISEKLEKPDIFSSYKPFKADPEYAKFYAELKKKYGDYALVNLTAEENAKLVKLSKNNVPAKGTPAPKPVEQFRGTKDDIITGDELFHATTPDRIDKIASEGLKINTGGREAMSNRGDINPLFFSDSPRHALGFINDLKNEKLIKDSTKGVLLRVRGLPKENLMWDSLGKNNSVTSGGSWSFDKNIPAKYIEIKENGVWKPLSDFSPEGAKSISSDTINVSDFAKKVKAELLPLKRSFPSAQEGGVNQYARYENIALPEELRGNVKNYNEVIYQSPIETSAGSVHFGREKNYFGHTRIEDMADNKTRRVIEVQSDLYQKGNLEKEYKTIPASERDGRKISEAIVAPDGTMHFDSPEFNKLKSDKQKLSQYNDPTAHFRMIKEEIKKAAQDGKTKLQFPTGETAMKIEGLGDNVQFYDVNRMNETRANGMASDLQRQGEALSYATLKPTELKVGQEVSQGAGNQWIITDVLGDGKFKAVPKRFWDTAKDKQNLIDSYHNETFDISGKVDTNNPIYKFYEKEMQKYLNKFDGKRVIDDKGVSWIEVPIKKEYGDQAVEAFGKIGMSPLFAGAGLGLAGVATAGTIKKKSIYKNGK